MVTKHYIDLFYLKGPFNIGKIVPDRLKETQMSGCFFRLEIRETM